MSRRLSSIAALFLVGGVLSGSSSSSLDWIAGHWCTTAGEQAIEEVWLSPHGGVTVGLGRTTTTVGTTDRTTAFEYLRIVGVEGVQTYIAQPGGRPPTAFGRTAGGTDWIRFENRDHDFPQRVEYRRDQDRLRAQVAGPGRDGEEVVLTFDYRLCER